MCLLGSSRSPYAIFRCRGLRDAWWPEASCILSYHRRMIALKRGYMVRPSLPILLGAIADYGLIADIHHSVERVLNLIGSSLFVCLSISLVTINVYLLRVPLV